MKRARTRERESVLFCLILYGLLCLFCLVDYINNRVALMLACGVLTPSMAMRQIFEDNATFIIFFKCFCEYNESIIIIKSINEDC